MRPRSVVTVAIVVSIAIAFAAGIASYQATKVLARANDTLLQTKDATLALERI